MAISNSDPRTAGSFGATSPTLRSSGDGLECVEPPRSEMRAGKSEIGALQPMAAGSPGGRTSPVPRVPVKPAVAPKQSICGSLEMGCRGGVEKPDAHRFARLNPDDCPVIIRTSPSAGRASICLGFEVTE